MSRFRAERVRLWIGPTGAVLRWRNSVRVIQLGDAVAWPEFPRAAAALAERLSGETGLGGTRWSVELSSSWVRFALLPWHPGIVRDSARQALAEQQFFETFGEGARGYRIIVDKPRLYHSCMATAIEDVALESLHTLARSVGAHIDSIQAGAVRAFNAHRGELKGDPFWFVAHERHGALVLLWRGGQIERLRTYSEREGTLATLLEREWLLLGLDGPPCPCFLVNLDRSAVPAGGGRWPVSVLGEPGTGSSPVLGSIRVVAP